MFLLIIIHTSCQTKNGKSCTYIVLSYEQEICMGLRRVDSSGLELFFFWNLISKKNDVVTNLESRVAEDTFWKQLPLTEVRIKNKVVNLNAVRTGEKVTARYVLYNTGNNPLFIEYVNPDCSCTGYEVSDSITFPGDSLQIMLKFDTTGKAGINFMSAVVKANTSTALYKLSFVVDVLE